MRTPSKHGGKVSARGAAIVQPVLLVVHLPSKRRVPSSSPGQVKIQERWYSRHIRKNGVGKKLWNDQRHWTHIWQGISPGESLNYLPSHQHGNDLPSLLPCSCRPSQDLSNPILVHLFFFFQNVLSFWESVQPDQELTMKKKTTRLLHFDGMRVAPMTKIKMNGFNTWTREKNSTKKSTTPAG